MNKKLKFLTILFILINLNSFSQNNDIIKFGDNNYKITISKIEIQDNECYELFFYYPQRVFVKKDSNNNNLKIKQKQFCFIKDTILNVNEKCINDILKQCYNKAFSNFNYYKKRNDTINYTYNNEEIAFNEKPDTISAKQLKNAYNKIYSIIKNYSILKDINKEKPIGNIVISEKIPEYEKTRAIPLSFMPLLSNHKKTIEGLLKNNELNHNSDSNLYINYYLLKKVKKQILDSKKDRMLKKEIRKFKRKLRRLQNIKWKNNVRYKGEIISDSRKIRETKVINGNITFENSTIKYLNINTENDITYYSTYSIPLKAQSSITKNYEARLYNRFKSYAGKNTFIKLGDVFKYNFIPQNYTDDFSPKDTCIRFKLNKNEYTFPIKKQSMSSAFDIRVYSDLTGLFGDLPAGVIQTEAVAHFKLNTNWPRKTSIKLFNYFEPSFNYASFKDEYSNLFINEFKWGQDTVINIDALDLQRYSNYNSGININFARIGIKKLSSTLDINIFGNILNTNLSYNTVDSANVNLATTDTIVAIGQSNINKNLYSVVYGTNLRWRAMQLQHFGVDVSIKLYGLGLINSGEDYRLVNYTSIDNFEEIKSVKQGNLVFFYNPSITIFYKPNIGGSGSMFFRSTYFGCFGDNVNSYLFIQFGYSVSINDIIKNKK